MIQCVFERAYPDSDYFNRIVMYVDGEVAGIFDSSDMLAACDDLTIDTVENLCFDGKFLFGEVECNGVEFHG